MGKVVVAARIQNSGDLYNASRGQISDDQIRTIEIPDAMVDTGATGLSMPRVLIDQLGLRPVRSRLARTAAGTVSVQMFESIQLTIHDRVCTVDVHEIAEGCPTLIGQIPLEALDLIVNPTSRQLVGNPDHGGEHMIEIY